MARNHARVLTSIWNDPDFLVLTSASQRVFLLLLSQQNISHAGLLPLTVTRWANKSPDTTVEQIETAIEELERRRFVVVDRTTEELLIRTFMRGDEAWKHWKVMTAAARDVEAIASSFLRVAVAVEVARMLAIPVLSTESKRLLERLSDGLPSPTDCQPIPDASPQGQGKVTVVTTDDLPLPLHPAPAPAPAASAEPPPDPTSALLIEHSNAYDVPPSPSALTPVRTAIMRLVAEHVPPERISAGLARMRERNVGPGLLPQLVVEAANGRASPTDRNTTIIAAARQRAQAAEAEQTRKALP